MEGKLLIVEDEPIVALDLQQEAQEFGWEVIGLAESADEALMAVEEDQPNLAILDIRIAGSLDGIQTARLLRDAYGIPAVFLTSYSDDITINRASREMPYGYLTKPINSRELKATLQVALHKASVDAGLRTAHSKLNAAVNSMHEAVILVSSNGDVLYINATAEHLTGRTKEGSIKRNLQEVLIMRDQQRRPISIVGQRSPQFAVEGFGVTLHPVYGDPVLVDYSISPLKDDTSKYGGYVILLRKADERLRTQTAEGAYCEIDPFDAASMPMLQMDGNGHIMRVNQALLNDLGIDAESLIGHTLTSLSKNQDPQIGIVLARRLLQGNAGITSTRN
jgi:PAS domain S-box-containing protein